MAKEIEYGHHEWWNGTGYPQGSRSDGIPISARIMAVADVYDALVSHRVYTDSMSHEQAVGEVEKGGGTHFDPDIVDAFIAVEGEFQEIARSFADSSEDIRRKFDTINSVVMCQTP